MGNNRRYYLRLVSTLKMRVWGALLALRGRYSVHLTKWRDSNFAMPAPQEVKWAVLARYDISDSTWIETGTLFGDTTSFLSTRAKHVYSVEPDLQLASRATKRFAQTREVTIVNGLSEDHLDDLLSRIDGPTSLWLDGHFSGGVTFQGPLDTPIKEELRILGRHISRLVDVAVFIDDLRLFDASHPDAQSYPGRTSLVNWAEQHRLWWTIEHDIFVARTASPFRA